MVTLTRADFDRGFEDFAAGFLLRLSSTSAKKSAALVDNSFWNKGNIAVATAASETLAMNFGVSGCRMFSTIVDNNSEARSPKVFTARALIPLSTAIVALARIFWASSISTAPARISSSRTARVGMPRPYFRASVSNVMPLPYMCSSAGFPSGPVNLGFSCHAANIRLVDCC